MIRPRAATLVGVVLLGLSGMAAGAVPARASQAPPALSSEEMLRLVLPLDAAGQRPGVIAWARLDDFSARDGSPQVFVTLLYETAAPFGRTELRRLVNRVSWTGERYQADLPDEPGDVLSDEPAWLGLPRWSVEIEIRSNRSEGNPIYTVAYRGSGPLADGVTGDVTYTELFRPSTDFLWSRLTELRTVTPRSGGGQDIYAESVTYRFEMGERGPDTLVAGVLESSTFVAVPGERPDTVRLQEYAELYPLRAGRYRLETRVPVGR